MENVPLFSVIIPVYNAEAYLEECVASVQKQKCNNLEIILINDGSIDSSSQICEALKKTDNRIKVVHQKNCGVSFARKKGSEFAQGEYLLFVDSDDWISESCISNIDEIIKKHPVDIICFGLNYDNGNEYIPKPLRYRYGYYSKQDIIDEVFPMLVQKNDATYFAPSLCGKVIRRNLFERYALSNRNCTIGEDGACVIPCVFNAQSMVVLEECMYFYRYNRTSATKGRKVVPWECPQIISEHISAHIDVDAYDFKDQINRKLAHDIFSLVISQFYRTEPYRVIIADLQTHLESSFYRSAITRCTFSCSLKAKIMEVVLKKRLYFLIYLFVKLRNVEFVFRDSIAKKCCVKKND